MQNTNRLIDDFKKLTKTTIWKHLNAMAVNYAVYSTHLKGFPPYLTDFGTYLYCTDTNMVIVSLDCCGHDDSLTYKESQSLSALILANGCKPRISTVFKLAKTVQLAKERLQGTDIKVYGILLTEAQIVNADELKELWEQHNLMVIDGFRGLKYRSAGVNDDDELPCKEYVKKVVDCTDETPTTGKTMAKTAAPATEASEDEQGITGSEEFGQMLDRLLKEGAETKDEDDTANITFPDGEIQQNQDLSVKVEILAPLANPREELNRLVGCADIKRRLDELLALTRYNQMMRELFPNGKQHQVSLHSLFLGRPGTGKTTVCKIYGSLLHQAGVLSKGHVVVCDRGTFIGTLWGDEERSVKQVVDMAKGGVLMIDEAYLLNGKHENDPGKLVIQLLMNILADEKQRDIAIVLCGYKEPMMRMLDMNPGLLSRFPNKFEFADFTVDELKEITCRRIKDYNYRFTIQAWGKYSKLLADAYQVRDPETWGNARFVANQLERIYLLHASRCVRQQPKDKKEILLLTPEDIAPIETPRQRPRIGF
ncbi:MAG: AAA family ATPase [Prevotella sp.]|nr:AAA family ATPase [Prevotella sp.]